MNSELLSMLQALVTKSLEARGIEVDDAAHEIRKMTFVEALATCRRVPQAVMVPTDDGSDQGYVVRTVDGRARLMTESAAESGNCEPPTDAEMADALGSAIDVARNCITPHLMMRPVWTVRIGG